MEILPSVLKYLWGKSGYSSTVAQLAEKTLDNFVIDPNGNYAELWMGTHQNGESFLKKSGESLKKFIEDNPEDNLGHSSRETFGDNLPFLFKILSVEKALSIQAHPDKILAEFLHKKDPVNYPDDNHKPELAIALTPFEMMCGFRNYGEIIYFLQNVPELANLIGDELIDKLIKDNCKENLKLIFTKLMKSSNESIINNLIRLLERISKLNDEEKNKLEADLILRLSSQFPGDIGIFCVFFLQHFTLEPGSSVYLPANEPHAYIFGDCVECMAASDNVTRAGLTPKYRDVETLCEMLTYETGINWIHKGQILGNGLATLYNPPIKDFAVMKYESSSPFSIKPHEGTCSILICVKGMGRCNPQSGVENESFLIQEGTILFIPSKSNFSGMQIIPLTEENPCCVIFEAFSTPCE